MDNQLASANAIFEQLKSEFNNIKPESRLQHLRQRLSAIKDDSEKSLVEDMFLFLQQTGLLNNDIKPVLVAMIHGIRTRGEWHDDLKNLIESKSDAVVKPISFGFFDAVSFWLPLITIFRHLKVKHVTKQMRLLRRDFPNHQIVIVAHSFGTFLTANFMKKNTDYDIDRLLLCGSIVSENFDWDSLPNFPRNGRVMNDIGNGDIWPILAKTSTFGYGASGSYGFNTHTIENRYHDYGHSGFFCESTFNDYWLPFILEGRIVSSPATLDRKPKNYIFSLLTLFQGVGLIILLAILFIIL